MRRVIRNSTVWAFLLPLALSESALASGFMVRENSAAALGTIYSGNGSRAEGADTVFNNPAGMARLEGTQVEAGAVVLFPSIKFDGSASVMGSPVPGDNGGNGGETAVIPHLYGKLDVNERLALGLAVTVPFGNAVNYDSTPAWSGRYVGIKTAALSFDINPAIAYRLSDRIAIGAGLSAQYFKLEHSAAIPQFLIFGAGTPDAFFRLKVDDWDYGFNLGALVDLDSQTRLGVTYRSKVDHGSEGTLNFIGAHPMLGVTSGPARADVSLPATTGVSLTHEFSADLALSSDVQFTQWSTFDQVVVESANGSMPFVLRYQDSWMISVGAVYRLNPTFTLRGGLGWDQTPVTDRYRTVGVPDTDRYMVGAGFGIRLGERTSLDGAYAHYFASENASMNTSINAIDPFTNAVVLSGRYRNHLDYVALTLKHRL